LLEQGVDLNDVSDRLFDEGTAARQHADEYIRTTVVLATILFLLVLSSQRFRIRRVRFGLLVVAIGLMAYGLIAILTSPRL
jgi:glycerol uptake facilitator-like aquaporin